jgi:fibronectin type 3 domain-containing protein
VQLFPNSDSCGGHTWRGHAAIALICVTSLLIAACGGESDPSGSQVGAESDASSSSTAPVITNNNAAILEWDAVTSANLDSYRVYFGETPGSYLQPSGQGIPVGNVTTYTVTGLSSSTRYYFTVVAVDKSGNESPPSNVVFKDIP